MVCFDQRAFRTDYRSRLSSGDQEKLDYEQSFKGHRVEVQQGDGRQERRKEIHDDFEGDSKNRKASRGNRKRRGVGDMTDLDNAMEQRCAQEEKAVMGACGCEHTVARNKGCSIQNTHPSRSERFLSGSQMARNAKESENGSDSRER